MSGALSRFARAVRDRFGARVSEVILFGSYAHGEAHEESDVDVLVLVDELRDAETTEIIDMATAIKQSTDPWVALSPRVLSTAQAGDLRARGRLLWTEIAAQGLRL